MDWIAIVFGFLMIVCGVNAFMCIWRVLFDWGLNSLDAVIAAPIFIFLTWLCWKISQFAGGF